MNDEKLRKALEGIRASLASAESYMWPTLDGIPPGVDLSAELVAASLINGAFLGTLTLCERLGLPMALARVEALYTEAQGDKMLKSEMGPEDRYLIYPHKLYQELGALSAAWGLEDESVVSRDLIQILRGCAYSITDPQAFGALPSSEDDVHKRIEAVLRCVFPDLKRKPTLSKPLKNFEPDTGIPILRTLIEYKFIKDASAVAVVSDQILADTRGYTSADWDRFVYVVYETARFQPEEKWAAHLRQSGVGTASTVVVLSGTPPGGTTP